MYITCVPTHATRNAHTYELIYIYIYIYSHARTDCFVVSQLFRVARHVGLLKLGSKSDQLYVRLSIRPLSQITYHDGLRNYKVLCSNSSGSSVRLFTFYTLLDTRMLNSFEELYIYATPMCIHSPVGFRCRIHWRHLCRGIEPTSPTDCLAYDVKQLDNETQALDIWGIYNRKIVGLPPQSKRTQVALLCSQLN